MLNPGIWKWPLVVGGLLNGVAWIVYGGTANLVVAIVCALVFVLTVKAEKFHKSLENSMTNIWDTVAMLNAFDGFACAGWAAMAESKGRIRNKPVLEFEPEVFGSAPEFMRDRCIKNCMGNFEIWM